MCREAGARVTTNVSVRDMDLAVFDVMDSKRLEVVGGFGCQGWGQMVGGDCTVLCCPVKRKGGVSPGTLPRPCGRSTVVTMEHDAGLQCGEGFRPVSAWSAGA